jgi:hypothetical protein
MRFALRLRAEVHHQTARWNLHVAEHEPIHGHPEPPPDPARGFHGEGPSSLFVTVQGVFGDVDSLSELLLLERN